MESGLIQVNSSMVKPIGKVLSGVPEEVVRDFVTELVEYGLIDKEMNIVCTKSSGEHKTMRDDLVKRIVMFLYEFRRHPKNPDDLYYKRWDDDVFRTFDKDSTTILYIVNDIYDKLFHRTPSAEVSSTIKNVINNIHDVARLDSGVIKLGSNVYWIMRDARISTSIPDGLECYYELFNSPVGGQFPTIELNNAEALEVLYHEKLFYQDNLSEHVNNNDSFEEFYKTLPMDFDFIKVWADKETPGFVDRYWDMLLAIVPNFLYKKPPVAYFLLGNARGGKSSYTKMLHLIFGSHNTSTVRLNELGDPHLNLRLSSTILNAPDEEMEEKLTAKDMANFKSLAAHEQLELPVLYSTKPQVLQPNFMMYLPSNALPQFNGSGAEACMRRARTIIFSADLSKLDHVPKDFIGETFTKDTIIKLLGTVLALAKYFSKHEFWYSVSMLRSNDLVSQSVNSSKLYFDQWSKYFDGVDKRATLWNDYRFWCTENDYKIEEKRILMMRFMKYFDESKRVNYKDMNGARIKAFRIPEVGKKVLTPEFMFDGYREDTKYLHEHERSMVHQLEAYHEYESEHGLGGLSSPKALKLMGEAGE